MPVHDLGTHMWEPTGIGFQGARFIPRLSSIIVLVTSSGRPESEGFSMSIDISCDGVAIRLEVPKARAVIHHHDRPHLPRARCRSRFLLPKSKDMFPQGKKSCKIVYPAKSLHGVVDTASPRSPSCHRSMANVPSPPKPLFRNFVVAYLMVADKYLGPLASRLSGINQPVICTPTVFSTHHLPLVTCIGAYLHRSTPRSSTTPVS